jgi:hypothetical protein
MNGRVDDPKLGRFLSPDIFVTDPLNTQSFNKYSYCLNNPLIKTDPSGFDEDYIDRNDEQRDDESEKIWVITLKEVDIIDFRNDFVSDNRNMSDPIVEDVLKDDEHNPENVGIHDPRFPGVEIHFDKGREFGFFFPGLGIHVGRYNIAWIQHEYGHYLQDIKHGFLDYLLRVTKESAMDAAKGQIGLSDYETHSRLCVEIEANTLAHDFFGSNSQLNTEYYPTIYNTDCNCNFNWNEVLDKIEREFNAWDTWNGIPWWGN